MSLLLLLAPTPTISDSVSAIPDLSARWRADQITGLSNGDPVASWPDASGYGNDATQSFVPSQPAWTASAINSQPAVYFAGDPRNLVSSTASSSAAQQTLVAVLRTDTISADHTIRAATGNGGLQVRLNSTGNIQLLKQGVALLAASSGTVSNATDTVVTVTFDQAAGIYAITINGASAGSGSVSTTLTPGLGTVIGKHPDVGNETLDGSIAELLTWPRVLTGPELATVHTYTTARYSVPSVAASGTATGTTTATGAATGARTPKATALGTATFTGSAIGKRVARATATGTITATGTAVAATQHRGAAAGTTTATGTTAGKHTPQASSLGTVTATGTATGMRVLEGSTVGTVTITGSATGQRTPKASLTGVVTITGTAVGFAPTVDTSSGTASGTVAVTGAAVVRQPDEARDITLTVSAGRTRRISAVATPRRAGFGADPFGTSPFGGTHDGTLSVRPGRSRTVNVTGTDHRELVAAGRSLSITVDPRE